MTVKFIKIIDEMCNSHNNRELTNQRQNKWATPPTNMFLTASFRK